MRKIVYLLICLQLALVAQLGFANMPTTKLKNDSPATTDIAQVRQAYQDWTNAVASAKGNAEKVASFYAPNAILLATLSPEIKLNLSDSVSKELFDFTSQDIREYFVAFTSLKNIHATTDKIYTQLFNDVAINTGLYTFEYIDDKGKTVDVPARFTFVYEKLGDKWMIINHHSSTVPESH